MFLSVTSEDVTPYSRGNCNNNIIKWTEKKTLPCMPVFMDTGVVCPFLALVLVFHEDE